MTDLESEKSAFKKSEDDSQVPAPVSGEQGRQSRPMDHLRKKYQALLEGAPDAVFVAESESGEIVEANSAAASLLETSVEEIIGRHQSELHPSEEPEKYRALFDRHQEAARAGTATLRKLEDGSKIYVESDEGRQIPVEISASFVDLDCGELFVGIFRDISERTRRERELEVAKDEAEKTSRLKSALLRNMSQEIRSPITTIIGFSKVLTQLLEGEPERHAGTIYQAGQHLMKTIHSILEVSKLESGTLELEKRSIRLGRVAERAADLLGLQAEEKDLTVEISSPDVPVKALGNREALTRIAENLLENAIKFTPQGGRIEIRVRTDDGAILEIEDTGIGMDPETVTGLFEAFKQGSEGPDREYEGVGLGLPIVKKLTESLGGTIEVASETGKGTCVSVYLPRAEGDDSGGA